MKLVDSPIEARVSPTNRNKLVDGKLAKSRWMSSRYLSLHLKDAFIISFYARERNISRADAVHEIIGAALCGLHERGELLQTFHLEGDASVPTSEKAERTRVR